MAKKKWWKKRPNSSRPSNNHGSVNHVHISGTAADGDDLFVVDGMNHRSISGATIMNSSITADQVTYEDTVTVDQMLRDVDRRVTDAENRQHGPDLDYQMPDGNPLNLTNSLRQLSMEGYQENELTDALRRLIMRDRVV